MAAAEAITATLRGRAAWGMAAATGLPVVAVGLVAPPAGKAGALLALALLVLAGGHVAATPWLFGVRAARDVVKAHPVRLAVAPSALLAAGVLAGVVAPTAALQWAVVILFAVQMVHYARQHVGVLAVGALRDRLDAPSVAERRAVIAAGCCGLVALLSTPSLLDVTVLRDRPVGRELAAAGLAACAVAGIRALRWRPRSQRPGGYVACYLATLGFSWPLVLTSNPYAAISGMTIAHGLQYLSIVSLVAAGPATAGRRRRLVACLVAAIVIGGIVLTAGSHLSDAAPFGRASFGLYLGAYAAHFCVDATLWRRRLPAAGRFVRHALGPAPTLVVR